MAAFVAKQMVGNKLSAVKGESLMKKLSRTMTIYISSEAIKQKQLSVEV
jgi:predicted GIY-YIG superfamily endonuclease